MQLHITNGDMVGDMLTASNVLQGHVLCWRDVLHDGPIVATEGLPYLTARANFIYTTMVLDSPLSCAEVSEQAILDDFLQRQDILDNLNDYSEIVLWFEHDLYDQLQLAECLYQLAKYPNIVSKVSLICIGEHPEVDVFHGLGNLHLEQLEALYPQRAALHCEQLALGQQIWLAMASATPLALSRVMADNLAPLPFMAAALTRFAQEYPSTVNGLSLTQQLILQTLDEQHDQQALNHDGLSFDQLFTHLQRAEDAPFLGDVWLSKELLFLAKLKPAYLCIDKPNGDIWDQDARYQISQEGRQAIQGKRALTVEQLGGQWRGGVNIHRQNYWCWDHHGACFVMR
ncbi:DUF1835 domain-containing protein [Agarivorans sp. TSD2052]|uniref:DUF1835 domain-containing protein n=1 Tax=Agarivorans sp. TSD2052 TaxID=2937286 RepID=UPI00201091AD|nr:DUF1835 domain-containing protein [Agarivorans sp. TSD2052]UPW16772.1 DUF1835 domain-containing protein [Agarivorans sp. TSD2052]